MGGNLARAAGEGAALARVALKDLSDAELWFNQQGLDSWIAYLTIQSAKAYADLDDENGLERSLASAGSLIARFPVFKSHLYEAVGSIRTMYQHPDSRSSFTSALAAAQDCGLLGRAEFLKTYLSS